MRETSHKAYLYCVESGVLGAAQEKVYRILYHLGPMTGSALSAYGGVTSSGSTLFKRISELHRIGVVQDIGTVKNEKTGRPETVWDVTSKLPVGDYKPPKSKSASHENEQCARIADEWGAPMIAHRIRRRVEK